LKKSGKKIPDESRIVTGFGLVCRLTGNRLLWMGLSFLIVLPLWGQDYRINTILPYLKNDSLMVDIAVLNFPEGKIRKTLLAGIPLDIDLSLILLNSPQRKIAEKVYDGKILYDVWEEHFQVKGLGEANPGFSSLEQLQDWFGNLCCLTLTSFDQMKTGEFYRVKAELKVVILGKKQSQELTSWLQKSDQTEEDIATEDRSTGFRLNLNQLIQLFFSGEGKQEMFRASVLSAKFTVADLNYP